MPANPCATESPSSFVTSLSRVTAMLIPVLGLCLTGAAASAGPNAGGVLVVHAANVVYTSTATSYMGLSGVACGQDEGGSNQDCPFYEPSGGPIPCVSTAADPVSTIPAGVPQVWFVLAAFAEYTCPRLKAAAFGIDYQNVVLIDAGYDTANCFTVEEGNPVVPGSLWPDAGGQTAWNWTGDPQQSCVTSHLWELYWFAGYAYAGEGEARFELRPHSQPYNRFFVDDQVPPVLDRIEGYGSLGFLGSSGSNPDPVQTYACCFWDQCVVLTTTGCDDLCGVATGFFYCFSTTCLWRRSEMATGACCAPGGSCRICSSRECGCAGDFWLGEDITCLPDPCPGGACCLVGGSCAILLVNDCSAAGGRFLGDAQPCEPTTCDLLPVVPMSWGRLKRSFR